VLALGLAMSVPANLFGTAEPVVASELPPGVGGAAIEQQGLAVVDSVIAAEAPEERDGYASESFADVERARYQAAGEGFAPGYIPTTGSVRWPFPTSVPISSGFGPRDGTFHYGLDFTPGAGVQIGAIADGVVTWVGWDNSGYGYYATIAHNINGVRVDSLYGHMIDGSSPLYPGQTVHVGDFVGLTGDTGYSFGEHLHLEIHINGVPIDPFPWMTQNTTNDVVSAQ